MDCLCSWPLGVNRFWRCLLRRLVCPRRFLLGLRRSGGHDFYLAGIPRSCFFLLLLLLGFLEVLMRLALARMFFHAGPGLLAFFRGLNLFLNDPKIWMEMIIGFELAFRLLFILVCHFRWWNLYVFVGLLSFSSFGFSWNMLNYLRAIYWNFYLLVKKQIDFLRHLVKLIHLLILIKHFLKFLFWGVFCNLHLLLLDIHLNQIIIELLLPLFGSLNLILFILNLDLFNLLKLLFFILDFETI